MKVLIAVDDSPTSAAAAATATELFGADRAEYLAIRVSPMPGAWGAAQPYGIAVPLTMPVWFEPPATDVGDLEDQARDAGIPDAEVVVDQGDPVQRIVQAAEEHDVDVIVVGSRQRGLLSRLIEPSVAQGVVQSATRPVLVVGEHD